MSLKAFHIFFITISTLLAVCFALWEIREFTRERSPGSLMLGIGSLLCAVGLVVYGRWFLHKLKGVS